jgi:predicted ABC-type ATPase
MPPQSSSAVTDDEYGLEAAKPAKAASTDDYGLEPANKPAPATTASTPPTVKHVVVMPGETPPGQEPKPQAGVMTRAVRGLNRGMSLPESLSREDLGNWYQSVFGNQSGQTPSDPLEAVGNVAGNTVSGMANAMKETKEYGEKFPEWSGARMLHKGLGYVPIAGPIISKLSRAPEEGEDTAGRNAEAIGGIIQLAAMHPAVREAIAEHLPPPETLAKPFKAATAVADKVARGTPITEAGKLEAAKQQALTVKKPTMTETQYAQQVTDAMPDLQKIAQDNKGKIKTPRQAVQAINARISQIEAPISDHVSNMNEPHQMVQPEDYQDRINKAIDQELSKRPGVYKPQEIEKAKKAVNDFLGDQPKSIAEIEGNRRRLNQDADEYHKSDTAGKRAIDVSDATATAQRAAANTIRDILYGDEKNPGKLEQAGVTATDSNGKPVSLRNVRRQVGRLLEVRDHFEDAITRAEATGDWKPFGPIFTGPSLAAGGIGVATGAAVGGPVGALFGMLAGEGAKAWGDYLLSKNPNLNTAKMFRNLANTSAPNVSQIQTMKPAAPPPVPVQQSLGLPTAAHGPLFNIEQTPRLRPDFEEPRLAPIQGQQTPLNIPESPEQAPLFSIPQTARAVPEQPRLSPNLPKLQPATAPIEAETSGLPKVNFRGTAANIEPAANATARISEPAKAAPVELKPGETTSDRFFNKETEQWAPERQKYHDELAEKAIAGKKPPEGRPPEATITMGGTGSGKTTVTRSIMADNPNLVNVDSDATKLDIPEYEGLKKSDPQRAAFRVHDESKAISKNIIKKTVAKGLDFVYDTSTGGGGEALFKKLKDLGYNVKIVFADIPVDEAIGRAKQRAESSLDPSNRGRVVPENIIRTKHQEAAQAFSELKNSPHVDEVRAFDNTNRTPEEFYTRNKNGEKVMNQKILDRVNEKAGVNAGKK